MANPCFCGCSLKTATLIIAVIDMILAAFLGIFVIIFGGMAIGSVVDVNPNESGHEASVGIVYVLVIVLMLMCIGKFLLGHYLKHASDQEDFGKCRLWLIVSSVLLVMGVICSVSRDVQAADIIGILIGITYHAFCLWVVYEFMQELKSGTAFESSVVVGSEYSNKV